jgi:hypothetical protein
MPRFVSLLLAILALAAPPAGAEAQTWPDKPIRFIVPSPPGGGTDSLTRLLANKLGETLKWQMVVDNRPGAGGNLGLDIAAKAAPDGYTLVMGESSNLAINPYLYKKLPFDPAKDVAPVALVGTVPLVLVVSANAPFDSLKALVDAAKKKQLTFASSGNGTVGHLVGEMWKRAVGSDMLHVPYKGAGPVMIDLVGGQVDLHFASPAGGAAPDRKRQAARAGDDVGAAPAVTAQRADVDRSGLSGFRLLRVLWGARAGRHARRHRHAAEHRDRSRHRRTGHEQELRRARRRCSRRNGRAIRCVSRQRTRQMGARSQGFGRNSRLGMSDPELPIDLLQRQAQPCSIAGCRGRKAGAHAGAQGGEAGGGRRVARQRARFA